MKKQAISTFLLVMLLLGTVSCGSTPTFSENSDTLDFSSTDAGTSDAVTVDPYEALPSNDLGGMEINIIGYGSSATYGDREFLTAEEISGDVIDDALFKRNSDTEQRLGVKINFYADQAEVPSINAFVNSVTAGETEYDMLAMKSYAQCFILGKGVLRSWSGIEGINIDNPWYIQDANEAFTLGGEMYSLFSDALGTNMTMAWAYVFNQALVEEWKLDDPYQLVRDGKWTMDTLAKMTKDVWKDLDGSGGASEGDLFGFYTDSWATLDACMTAHDIIAIKKDDNDLPVMDFYTERFIQSFESVYEMYWSNSGTYVITETPYGYVKNFAQGQAVFSPMYIQYLFEGDMRSMTDEYGLIPFPKLDEEQEDYCTYVHPRFGAMMLPVTLTEEKEAILGDFVEVWSAYSYRDLRPAIYEVSLQGKGVRDDESLEMLELIMNSRKYDFMTAMQYGGKFPLTNSEIYRNQIGGKLPDIASFYASKKEAAEQYIADLVKNLTGK